MRIEDAFSARAAALLLTENSSNALDYLGEQFFPNKTKMGMDLKWIKGHKGLPVSLKPSTLDSLATIRPRQGFEMQSSKMPLFRESMKVDEEDLYIIQRARDDSDGYVREVVRRVYDDAVELYEGARVAQERMRFSLLAPVDGNAKITIGLDDNTIYDYNYDPFGSWKRNHYVELSGTAQWTKANAGTSAPLTDLETAKTVLASFGFNARYAIMNSNTLNGLISSNQIKNAFITSAGVNVGFVSVDAARSVVEGQTSLIVLVYDKQYLEHTNGSGMKFIPDGYVSIVGDNTLGNTWLGTTPEELSLMADSRLDVSVTGGVALTRNVTYGPPVGSSITASQICLPSFEGMDGVYVIKAF